MSVWTELIILAGLSIFLLMRLWSILGTKTGHEQDISKDGFNTPKDQDNVVPLRPKTGMNQDNVIDLEPITYSDDILDTQRRLRLYSPTFSVEAFLRNSKKAYKMIIEAYFQEDTHSLQELLSDSVFKQFSQSIDSNKKKGLKTQTTISSIESCDLQSLSAQGSLARAVVVFESELVSFTTNSDGQITDNPAKLPIRQKDCWTFERDFKDSSPKWLLVETATPNQSAKP